MPEPMTEEKNDPPRLSERNEFIYGFAFGEINTALDGFTEDITMASRKMVRHFGTELAMLEKRGLIERGKTDATVKLFAALTHVYVNATVGLLGDQSSVEQMRQDLERLRAPLQPKKED